MKKILYINSCTRPHSRTDELSRYLLNMLEGEIHEIKLYDENIQPLNNDMLNTRDALVKSGDLTHESLRYAKDFTQADVIVVSAPYWDLLFPAVLRTYFEAVSVCGITFRYSEKGIPVGLCRAEKVYYVSTAGGFFGENNIGFSYVKALTQNLYGIKDVSMFSAQGLDIVGADVSAIMAKAKGEISRELGC